MSYTAVFNFDIDKENNQVKIERSFNASLDMVWDAWTKPELLDQWWAPKPWKSNTVSMEFKAGGRWFYYMEGPEGERHYCIMDYDKVEPKEMYSGLDAFADNKGTINTEMPRTNWSNSFSSDGETTTVHIVSNYPDLESLETVIEMGFQQGFTMALENLDEVLKNMQS